MLKTIVQVTGKSDTNLWLLKNLSSKLQGDHFEIQDSIVNQRLHATFCSEKDFELEKDILNHKSEPLNKVPFMPVNRLISEDEVNDILETLSNVLPTGQYTSGPYLTEFEDVLSSYLQKKYVIATSSGTDALMISLLASGLKQGDEVIMPANSFAATENAVLATGGVPVYVDIHPHTYCIDSDRIESAITDKTKFILPVHIYGKHADMLSIRNIADQFNLKVVEDACQAIGIANLGEKADITTLSFNPYKNIGVCGKGGAIATDNKELAEKCIQYSYHGFAAGKKNVKAIDYGFNSKMDNLQAAIGLQRIKYLSLNNFKRLLLANRYITKLSTLQNEGLIEIPELNEDNVWHLFPIKIKNDRRDHVMNAMKEKFNVETDLFYPVLAHKQDTDLVKVNYQEVHLPKTELAHREIVHLPLYPDLAVEEQNLVLEGLYHVIK